MEQASSTRQVTQQAATQQGQEQHGQEDMPLIDALDTADQTPLPNSSSAKKKIPSEALKKIRDQQALIKQLQRQLDHTSEALNDSENNKAELTGLLQATLLSPGLSRNLAPPSIPTRALETLGPHRLQERAQRPEDIEYQERLRQQTAQETPQHAASPDPNMLEFMKHLAKAMKDTNTSDLTEPSKFSGADHQWDEWHYQLRSYLEAKGWLQTYDHPTGPGTLGFDTEINKKLYNKLTMLCAKGTAITYLRKAAEFDGWGAGKQLKLRYHGFSKQRGKTLRNTVENLRHVHGTNITKHIDLFEKLITQMSHNDPLPKNNVSTGSWTASRNEPMTLSRPPVLKAT